MQGNYIEFNNTVKNCILGSGYFCSVSYSGPWPSAQNKHIFSNGQLISWAFKLAAGAIALWEELLKSVLNHLQTQ